MNIKFPGFTSLKEHSMHASELNAHSSSCPVIVKALLHSLLVQRSFKTLMEWERAGFENEYWKPSSEGRVCTI